MSLITEVLTRHHICFLKSCNRLSSIKELLDLLTVELGGRERLNLMEALMLREEFQSTAILPEVAIPHIRTGLVRNMRCALGISQEGIDFKAYDGKQSKFILLILLSHDQKQQYLSFLSHITELFSNKELIFDLLMAVSTKDVWKIIAMAENRYPALPCYAGRNRIHSEWP